MNGDKRIICISWNDSLSKTRELLLQSAGFPVLSGVHEHQARVVCRQQADLMILGHSVPARDKRWLIECFRQHSSSPVLSLLKSGETKLPEATFGVEADDPAEVLRTVRRILHGANNTNA